MSKKLTDIENEKLNAINQTFILMQDFLRDRMLFIADIFYKLSEEFVYLKNFKITGSLSIIKCNPSTLYYPGIDNYWYLEYDSSLNDFSLFSKDLLNIRNTKCTGENQSNYLCSFLCFFLTENENLCCKDLLDLDFYKDSFGTDIKVFINYEDDNIGIKINPEQIKMDKEMLLNRRTLHNNNFSWLKDNINKFFILNKTFCKMYDFMKSEIQKLYNRFNAYAESREIEGFSIFTNIHYQNTQRINDILDKRTLQIINRCLTDMNEEWLNMSIFNKPIFGCQTEDISLTWNFERFSQFLSEKEKQFRFNPYMRRDLIDGQMFSFEDIIRMKEEDFCIQWQFQFYEGIYFKHDGEK